MIKTTMKPLILLVLASGLGGWFGCTTPKQDTPPSTGPVSDTPTPEPSEGAKGPDSGTQRTPTPGPIITVEPKRVSGTSTYLAAWSSPSTGELAEANAGDAGYLRSDAFDQEHFEPTVRFLRVETTAGQTIGLSSLTLKLTKSGNVNTIKVWKDPDDYDQIKWSVNGTVLQRCYLQPSSCTPLCKSNSHGLPPEFFGTWDSATTVVSEPATDPAQFAKAKSRADYEPCP